MRKIWSLCILALIGLLAASDVAEARGLFGRMRARRGACAGSAHAASPVAVDAMALETLPDELIYCWGELSVNYGTGRQLRELPATEISLDELRQICGDSTMPNETSAFPPFAPGTPVTLKGSPDVVMTVMAQDPQTGIVTCQWFAADFTLLAGKFEPTSLAAH